MHFQGKLLTADPSILGDPYFHRAVVLIVDQNESGYVGFILNKPLGYSLEEALESLPMQDPLYFGGPVEKDNLFFIHDLGEQVPGSVPITEQWYWGGDFEQMTSLLKSPDRPPCFVRFFLGYAGWDRQQLQQELDNGSWMVSDDLSTVLSEENPTALWRDQMVRKGGNYLLWANTPENPYNN